ncbi:MAG: hypothetical protein HQK77_21485 [Desulfobacterales bacterium]|nr:hypothetical protein [Desulfobacterales bacterium]
MKKVSTIQKNSLTTSIYPLQFSSSAVQQFSSSAVQQFSSSAVQPHLFLINL